MRTLIATIFALALLPATALATEGSGTPDELPPAGEDVCAGEEGQAWGLCVAYCEAMDCDDEDTTANQNACDNVKAKYEDASGTTLPCEETCPCDGRPLWDETLAYDGTSCFGAPDRLVYSYTDLPVARQVAAVRVTKGIPTCLAINRLGPGTFALPITAEEYAVCRDRIQSRIDEVGLVCD